MRRIGLPVPGRLHGHHRGLRRGAATRTAPGPRGSGERDRRRSSPRSRSAAASGSATRSAPLLVSVRSGAVVSMPGMMDTILNLGIERRGRRGARRRAGNARFAWDSYRRFLQMFGEVVVGVPARPLRGRAEPQQGRARRAEPTPTSRRRPARARRRVQPARCARSTRRRLPGRPARAAAPRRSTPCSARWQNPRAAVYRRAHGISDDLGTAVNIMQMVFGNLGETSAHRRLLHAQPVDRRARSCTASSCSTPRARTSSPASARRGRSRELEDVLPDAYARARCRRWSGSSATTATCRTSSSRSSAARSTCCRRAPASAPRRPRCASRATWWPRA